MRKFVMLMAMLVMMIGFTASMGFAGEVEHPPTPPVEECEEFVESINQVTNININNNNDLKDRLGAGIDFVMHENQKENDLYDEVVIEYRRDFNNNVNEVYAVARLNVFNWLKNRNTN